MKFGNGRLICFTVDSFAFNHWSILGPGRHYDCASGSHQQQRGRPQYAQPHSNTSQARDRRESLSKYASVSQHGAPPNLPKSGAQRLAKQSSRGEIQADFMRTPDPGQSGYVDIYLMRKIFLGGNCPDTRFSTW